MHELECLNFSMLNFTLFSLKFAQSYRRLHDQNCEMYKPENEKLPNVTTARPFNLSRLRVSCLNKEPTKQKATAPFYESFSSICAGMNGSHTVVTPRPPKVPRTRRVNVLRTRCFSAPVCEKQRQRCRGQSNSDRPTSSGLTTSHLSKYKAGELNVGSSTRMSRGNDSSKVLVENQSMQHQQTRTSLGKQHTRDCMPQKSHDRPGTPIFRRARGRDTKTGEISVNSFSVIRGSDSTKWQLCDITETQSKQEETSSPIIDGISKDFETPQPSCDSTEVSKSEKYTYFSEDNQLTDSLTCRDLRSYFSPTHTSKDNALLENSLKNIDPVAKNETRELGVKHSNHSQSFSLYSSDSEENTNTMCEFERHKRDGGTRSEDDDHFKTARISNWIVQVSENMKYVT